MVEENVYLAFAQKSNRGMVFGNISHLTQADKTLKDDKFFPGKYDSDQINDIIYRLYKDFKNTKTEISHYQDIAVLIDLICSNKVYENSVEACDIIIKFPIE